MTVDEAIKTLEYDLESNLYEPDCDLEKAVKLGIEALKEAQRWRNKEPLHLPNLLPGETAD
jgi:20S proteasome alpha/beta subunit